MASALKNRHNRSLFHIKICVKMNSRFLLSVLWCCLLYRGLSGVAADEVSVSVMEGDSVTLQTDVKMNQQDKIIWYFSDTRIAQITGDLRKICTDVQCKDGDKRFRDRLKLDHQTGSLTIMNTTNTDSGVYHLLINGKSSKSEKIFRVTVHGLSGVAADEVSVSVMEGDSVTLQTDVKMDKIIWYFGDTRIAQITGDLRKICTDVQCKDGDERFRDRLKLDHQTGSLTIMNTRTTDSGLYHLLINGKSSKSEKIFRVTVHDPLSSAGEGTNATGIGGAVIGGVIGAVGVVLLIAAVPVVVYYRSKRSKKTKQEDTTVKDNHDERTPEENKLISEQNDIEMNDVSGKTTDQTVPNGITQ